MIMARNYKLLAERTDTANWNSYFVAR